MKASFSSFAVPMAFVLSSPLAAFAGGKGGGNACTTGTITLRMVTDKNGDGLPNYGDIVTFDVSTPCTNYPFITLRCYQNGNLVGQQSDAMFPGSLGENFTLGGSLAWQSGAADCIASLENWDRYYKLGAKSIAVIT